MIKVPSHPRYEGKESAIAAARPICSTNSITTAFEVGGGRKKGKAGRTHSKEENGNKTLAASAMHKSRSMRVDTKEPRSRNTPGGKMRREKLTAVL
ncbi:hypothetical protein TNCV_4248771 [Trichonephila clavipes]|nr:hypothetical protein TNCV_4248771 [Trichonephila clavipes]